MGRRSSKRSKTDLYAEVLEVISHYPEGARITKLSYGVGVPVDRLKVLVERLCRFGLARKAADDEGVYFGVTPRGLEFLDTFWKMKGFLEELGEAERY
ncbi:MAG TPA: winged helix-turn-helix domain-containing protein [Nitrososphaerales archaeon]|nr:winged helix-turn-helix domain-containing protein [Nitrososphaerales archaeon]